jgi:hypothetical protein
MIDNQSLQFVYVPQPIVVRKKSHRPPLYLNPHNNQVLPRPVFTCVDEVYSTGPVSYPTLQRTSLPFNSFNQELKDNRITQNRNYRTLLFTIIIIVIIICLIAIIVLLAVFLTR